MGHLRFFKAKQQMNPKGNRMMAKKMPKKVKQSSSTPTLRREGAGQDPGGTAASRGGRGHSWG